MKHLEQTPPHYRSGKLQLEMFTESLKNNENTAIEEILNKTLENLNKKANLKDTVEVVNKICNILISIKSPFHDQCKMTGTWIL
jgi:hypothetical protein